MASVAAMAPAPAKRRKRAVKRKPTMEKIDVASLAMTQWETDLYNALNHGADRIILGGRPGFGKTHATYQVATKLLGVPVYHVRCHLEASGTEVRGFYGKGLRWSDGIGVRALREPAGAMLLVDDIHEAGPDQLGILMTLLDSAQSVAITLPTGETVRPASANYRVIATTNGDVSDLPDWIASRLPVRILANEPASGLEASWNAWRKALRKLVMRSENPVDARQAAAFVRLAANGMAPIDAVRLTVASGDREEANALADALTLAKNTSAEAKPRDVPADDDSADSDE